MKHIHLFILVLYSSVGFLNPFGILSDQQRKFLFYLIFVITFVVAIRKRIRISSLGYPKTAYKCVIAGILVSIISVMLFQKQSLMVTVMTTIPFIFSYLYFYVLMRLSIPKEKILRVLIYTTFIGAIVYIINIMSYPKIVFGTEKDEYDMSRGIIRIGVPFIELFVLSFFFSINQWMVTGKKKWLCFILFCYVFIVLSVTRQYIFFSAVLGTFFLMKRASTGKKILVVGAIVVFMVAILPKVPIFKALMELTEAQAADNKYGDEDVRIRAWKFYTTEYQTNAITPIIGNGMPSIGNSIWAQNYEETTYYQYGGNGCFQADVGWAGFFWHFGIIATIGLFIFLGKAFLKKKEPSDEYLTYWMLLVILTSVTSGVILYFYQTISLSTVAYLIYGTDRTQKAISQ